MRRITMSKTNIHTDCYDCGHYLADNCEGKPEKCDQFAVASKVDATTKLSPPPVLVESPAEPVDTSVPPSSGGPGTVTTPPAPAPANAEPRGPGKSLSAKQADFDRLTARRVATFLHQMKLFHNLVGPNYKPTPEQVRRLEETIAASSKAFTAHVAAYLERSPV
jgi:hypothetical protein